MIVENFWPEISASELTPVQILEKQASYLKDKYDKKLMGQVITSHRDNESTITISFYLIHLGLDGYNYRLLSFDQNIETIYNFTVCSFSNPPEYSEEITTIGGFQAVLKNILNSPRTQQILNHLLTLGNVVAEDREQM